MWNPNAESAAQFAAQHEIPQHYSDINALLQQAGKDVWTVGKIGDIFVGRGITQSTPTKSNAHSMEVALALQQQDFHGLCFVNLVDFDSAYGHRNDIDGYANALREFDAWLPLFLQAMQPEDVLMITADHGCDPRHPATDHTREYVPLIVYGQKILPAALGTRKCFADVAASITHWLQVPFTCAGESFAQNITAEQG